MQKSKLIDDLIYDVSVNNRPVIDVRVGVSWTAVQAMHCGLAKTYGIPFKHGNYTNNMGNLTKMTTLELASYAHSWNLIEASIGCAAIASMASPPQNAVDSNAQGIIMQKSSGARVTMVGAFPFCTKLREVAAELYVLELDPYQLNAREGILPETAADYVIPDTDVLIISGSTLINKSLERLLSLARESQAYTVILGPSTIMSEVLFEYGADMLGGSFVINPEAIKNKISQSGGMLETKVCPGEIIFKVMQK